MGKLIYFVVFVRATKFVTLLSNESGFNKASHLIHKERLPEGTSVFLRPELVAREYDTESEEESSMNVPKRIEFANILFCLQIRGPAEVNSILGSI